MSGRTQGDSRPDPERFLQQYHHFASDLWRSPATEADLLKEILAYGNTVSRPKDDHLLSFAILIACEAFKLPKKVKMIELNDVFHQTDLGIWKSSPGFPWKKRGFKTKNDIRENPRAIEEVCAFWQEIKKGQEMIPHDAWAHVRGKH